MPIYVVRLGSPRLPGEGLRIGTVRRPPRGVPKAEYGSRDLYDLWLPELAPSEALLKAGKAAVADGNKVLPSGRRAPAADAQRWKLFVRRYRMEMSRPEARHLLDLLAVLSRQTNFSVGCYCADEARCHRAILRGLLNEHGAVFPE